MIKTPDGLSSMILKREHIFHSWGVVQRYSGEAIYKGDNGVRYLRLILLDEQMCSWLCLPFVSSTISFRIVVLLQKSPIYECLWTKMEAIAYDNQSMMYNNLIVFGHHMTSWKLALGRLMMILCAIYFAYVQTMSKHTVISEPERPVWIPLCSLKFR